MKSTPEQTTKRRELKRLVTLLGDRALKRFPDVASCGIFANKHTTVTDPKIITYDEFFVLEHVTKTIPAIETEGKIFLRFRRRVTRDGKLMSFWHVWEPGYAATKPETVEELLPIVRARVESFSTNIKK